MAKKRGKKKAPKGIIEDDGQGWRFQAKVFFTVIIVLVIGALMSLFRMKPKGRD